MPSITTLKSVEEGDYMDITTVSQVISSVGFPIVMCIMLFVQMVKGDENHKEELNSLKDCINNNTKVLTQLVTKLEMEVNDNGKN